MLLSNRLLFAIAGGLTVVIAGYLYWDGHGAAPPSVPPPPGDTDDFRLVSQPGLASRNDLMRETPAAGKHRAYVIDALTGSDAQLVNDLVADVPVTVTYGVQSKRHRVFTSDKRGAPLDASLVITGKQEQ